MRPFGWLPDWPKWEFRPKSEIPSLNGQTSLAVCEGKVVQDVDNVWAARLTSALTKDALAEFAQFGLEHFDRSHSVWDPEKGIETVWPTNPAEITLDMDPSLPPGYFPAKYKEALLGNSPLALFPKQVLSKTRMGFDTEAYIGVLEHTFLSPHEIDAKYSLEGSDNSEFISNLRTLVDDMRPLSLVLRQLRVRDTQLQVIIGLELTSLVSRPNDKSSDTTNQVVAMNTNLDAHFDRLCIWQAVASSDELGEFCSSVLIPYFKARAPRKTKQLVRISRGTLRSRSRARKRSTTPEPAAPSPGISTPRPAPGLLRALSLVHAPALPEDEPPVPTTSSTLRSGGTKSAGKSAARSISHPVYRQQSRHGQVEVRFKQSRRKPSERVSESLSAMPPPLPIPSVPAPQPASPEPVSNVIEATPTKVRTTYLESLPPATVLFDDAIGSTDSDD